MDVRDVAAASVAAIVRIHLLAGPQQLIHYYRNDPRPKDASSLPAVHTAIVTLPGYCVRHFQTAQPRFPQGSLLELGRTAILWEVSIVSTPPNQRRSYTSSTGASKSALLTLSRASNCLRRRREDAMTVPRRLELCQDLIYPMHSASMSIVHNCWLSTPLGPDHPWCASGNSLTYHSACVCSWWNTVLCQTRVDLRNSVVYTPCSCYPSSVKSHFVEEF